jgi:hypothetical protein
VKFVLGMLNQYLRCLGVQVKSPKEAGGHAVCVRLCAGRDFFSPAQPKTISG